MFLVELLQHLRVQAHLRVRRLHPGRGLLPWRWEQAILSGRRDNYINWRRGLVGRHRHWAKSKQRFLPLLRYHHSRSGLWKMGAKAAGWLRAVAEEVPSQLFNRRGEQKLLLDLAERHWCAKLSKPTSCLKFEPAD